MRKVVLDVRFQPHHSLLLLQARAYASLALRLALALSFVFFIFLAFFTLHVHLEHDVGVRSGLWADHEDLDGHFVLVGGTQPRGKAAECDCRESGRLAAQTAPVLTIAEH